VNISDVDESFLSKITDRLSLHFPSFRYRNFRLFFFGQLISSVGTWMQGTALSWLVLQITDSPFKLGLFVCSSVLTSVCFSPFMQEFFIDRFSKRKIIIFTQTSLAILAFVLGLLITLKVIKYHQILIIAFITGIINTIDMPARQAFYIELVPKEHLMNSIALNSSVFNFARIFGPAISGILIALVGYEWSFYLNALSFVPVIVALFFIVERTRRENKFSFRELQNINKEIVSGLKYITAIPIILLIFALFIIINVLGFNFNVLIPTLVKKCFQDAVNRIRFSYVSFGCGCFAWINFACCN